MMNRREFMASAGAGALILAATSHDFWLKYLTAPVWKRIHFLIYPAYVSVVAHVSLGILQDQLNHTFTAIFVGAAEAVPSSLLTDRPAISLRPTLVFARIGRWTMIAYFIRFVPSFRS